MFARMTRFVGLPPERIDQAVQEFEEHMLPALEQHTGFEGLVVMIDKGGIGQAVAVSFWDTLDNLKASGALADQARQAAVVTAGPERPPIIDQLEVVIQKYVATRGA